jgi:hypothetical protein
MSYSVIVSDTGVGDPDLIAALVCTECAGNCKYYEEALLCRYDCLRTESKCHCDFDKRWSNTNCDSDCGDTYGYALCRCCKICKATVTLLLNEKTREELKITDNAEDENRTGDSCSRCNRKVYHKFSGFLEAETDEEDNDDRGEYESIYLKVNEVCINKLHRLVRMRAGKHLKERKKTYFEKKLKRYGKKRYFRYLTSSSSSSSSSSESDLSQSD